MPIMEKNNNETALPKREKKAKKAKIARSRLPVKRSINLAQVNAKRVNWRAAVPAVLLVLLAAGAFGKFAVADRFAAVAEIRGEVRQLQAQLDERNAELATFAELDERYAHYTISDMTQEELERVDRVAVMDLLRRTVLTKMDMDSWSVSENVLTLSVSGKTLQEINLLMQALLNDDMVDYCTVSTAEMTPENGRTEETDSETVSAVVIVYLKNATEEARNG